MLVNITLFGALEVAQRYGVGEILDFMKVEDSVGDLQVTSARNSF